jgi:hypothetical protein
LGEAFLSFFRLIRNGEAVVFEAKYRLLFAFGQFGWEYLDHGDSVLWFDERVVKGVVEHH